MSVPYSTEEFLNVVSSWQNRATDPNAGLGTARGLGSVWDRTSTSTFPSPVETYFKLNAVNQGWARENLVNLRIFNVVRDFGVVGDGVTNNTNAIRAAVAAADAAGGGILYFPPAVLGYGVQRIAGQEGVIPID